MGGVRTKGITQIFIIHKKRIKRETTTLQDKEVVVHYLVYTRVDRPGEKFEKVEVIPAGSRPLEWKTKDTKKLAFKVQVVIRQEPVSLV